jgi:hypothetical protein
MELVTQLPIGKSDFGTHLGRNARIGQLVERLEFHEIDPPFREDSKTKQSNRDSEFSIRETVRICTASLSSS